MNRNPVLLLGLFDTSIMTARCFQNKGVKVYGTDYDSGLNGFRSNAIESFVCPNPKEEGEERWLSFLIEWMSTNSKNPFILIPTSDEYVELIAKYQSELNYVAKFLVPNYHAVGVILNRDKQFESAENAGIKVPKTLAYHNEDWQPDNTIIYPLAIKPLNMNVWKTKMTNKGFLVSDREELDKALREVRSKQLEFMVQEVIDGPNTNNFEVNTILLPNGTYFQHTIQKLRQLPDRFGTATAIRSSVHKELEALAIKLLNKEGLWGFSNMEFKYCDKRKDYYYIENNPRVWLQVNFTKNMGINFPLIYYSFLSNEPIPNQKLDITERGVWVDFLPDLLFWYRYRKTHQLSFLTFIRSWTPVKGSGLFSLRDIRPMIHEVKQIFTKKR